MIFLNTYNPSIGEPKAKEWLDVCSDRQYHKRKSLIYMEEYT